MDTKLLFTIVLIFANCFNIYCQYDLANMQKYADYRNRFNNNFIVVGEEAGKSLPIAISKEWKDYCGNGVVRLEGGEVSANLGKYIGFLGTEYLVLKNSNLDFSNTIQELYYALEAFNRLDLFAETVNGYNMNPKLDGFFVREDFPENFVSQNPSLNNNTVNSPSYLIGSGKPLAISSLGEQSAFYCVDENGCPRQDGYNNLPMSQDHTIGMLWGLFLANKCLDDEIPVPTNPFSDGITEIKQETTEIFKRIYQKCEEDNWVFKTPNDKYVGNCDVGDDPSLLESAGLIFFSKSYIKAAYEHIVNKQALVPVTANLGRASLPYQAYTNDIVNLRMIFETVSMSGNLSAVHRLSRKQGWDIFFSNYGIFTRNWNLNNSDKLKLKKRTEFFLNSAPCEGPFCHKNDNALPTNLSREDFGKLGWAAQDKMGGSIKEQYVGTAHPWSFNGNYFGLDYLLLHNLYYINNQESLGNFVVYSPQSSACEINYKNLDYSIIGDDKKYFEKFIKRDKRICKKKAKKKKRECKKEAREEKRECKSDANTIFRNCKNIARTRKRNCINGCNGQRRRARRRCKRNCRETFRTDKRNCRQTKRTTKQNCKDVFRLERDTCKIEFFDAKLNCSNNYNESLYIFEKMANGKIFQ